MTEIYASEPWYRQSVEPEQIWQGVLQEQDVPRGPASRSALLFNLLQENDRLLNIYAANVEEILATFASQEVLIQGKLVDLSQEGFGPELWIAFINPTAPSEQ